MKVRIKGNSVRFRLTKTEVDTFCTKGYIKEETNFDGKKFGYALQADVDVKLLDADFAGDTITMYLNKKESLLWGQSERVGFSCVVRTKKGNALSLLLEKDFVCMDETVEDQSDNYPNPKAI
ncbi:DUF7009 family protein [Maribacter sp. CXY002]|uniref:DUF7009 family protein n=1 Tax=Maribacter luteocoastalis TaxID=3407671 RepID=UPI003B682899